MERIDNLDEFLEYELNNNYIIEPHIRNTELKQRLLDVLNTYNPGKILKIGIGNGSLLLDIINNSKSYTFVVEPSLKTIQTFINKNGKEILNKVKIINGNFHELPIDYYAADLVVCIDYIDFFDSSKCIDEFKRALQFEGVMLVSTVVLNNEDIDGIYDDFMKIVFPLHNDFYLPEDLKTFLELKEFKFVKSMHLNFERNLKDMTDYFQKIYKNVSWDKADNFIIQNSQEFKKLLKMDDKYKIEEPYYIGVYMRNKPKK